MKRHAISIAVGAGLAFAVWCSHWATPGPVSADYFQRVNQGSTK